MPRSESELLIQEWLDEAAAALGFRRSGMAIWTKGSDHKVVAAISRSRFGNAYRLRLLVFFDPATRSMAASRADIDLQPVLAVAMNLFALELCLDFERPSPDRDVRKSIVVSTLIAKVGPLMQRAVDRTGLTLLIRDTGIASALPVWAREALDLD